MNQLPSISDLLDIIDPEKTLKREQVVSDITLVVLLKTINETKGLLSEETNKELTQLLQLGNELNITAVKALYEKDKKLKEFDETTLEIIDAVRKDYMKTQLSALSKEKQDAVCNQFPPLKELLVETMKYHTSEV
jgi:uncharacterized Fe-S cluster-containing radical SAM superfamily protein